MTKGSAMGNLLTAVLAAAVVSALVGYTITNPVKVKSTFGDKTD
jgi:hypothetical protein